MNDFDLFRQNGNVLEQVLLERPSRYLPGYLYFWARFIGSNGKSELLPMTDATPEANVLREILLEHIYTIFEGMALCWRIEGQVQSLEEFADNLNHWMTFYAHLRRNLPQTLRFPVG